MSDPMDFESRYAELRASYLVRVEERVEEIEALVEELRGGFRDESFEELYQLVHRLSGSGETMGFEGISEASIALEERLEEVDPDNSGRWLERVEAYCQQLRAVLEEASV